MATLRNLWTFWRMHFRGPFRQVLRRFTWEFLQTGLGYWAGCFAILRFPVKSIGQFEGAIVICYPMARTTWGGVSLGTVILGDVRICPEVNNSLFMHEFGHTLQSRASGPLYLFKYGLPSLRSAMSRGVHYLHPVEQDANRRSCAHFSQLQGFTAWPQEFNPIVPESRILPIQWWEYVPLVFPVWPLYRGFLSQKMARPFPDSVASR